MGEWAARRTTQQEVGAVQIAEEPPDKRGRFRPARLSVVAAIIVNAVAIGNTLKSVSNFTIRIWWQLFSAAMQSKDKCALAD